MSTRYAVANSTDPSATTAWSATRGGASGATVPVTGDTAFVEDYVNWDVTAMAAVDLEYLYISTPGIIKGWTIAVSNNASGSTCVVRTTGNGRVNLTAGTNGIDQLDIQSTGGGQFTLDSGTLNGIADGLSQSTAIKMGSGCKVDVGSSAVIAGYIKQTGGSLNVAFNATAMGGLLQNGGNSNILRRTNIVEIRGQNTVGKIGTSPGNVLSTAVGTRLIVESGATYIHDTPGTLTFAVARTGGNAVATDWSFTLTNSEEWQGGKLFRNATSTQITKTNPTQSVGSGDLSFS